VSRIVERLPEPRRSYALGSWCQADPEPQRSISAEPAPILRFPARDGGDDLGAPAIRVLLGREPGGSEVWWEPATYSNPHVGVSGETGSGKTQSLMAVASELHRQQVPLLILDFKDDYGAFAEAEEVEVWDPAEARLPFNLLTPVADADGRVEPLAHVHRVADVVKRVWGLGDQRAHRLREALKRCYLAAGVALDRHVPPPRRRWPAFSELVLEERDTLRGRLSPVFDLRLLDPAPQAEVGFARLVEAGGIVRLARLPGDEAKSAVAELLLLALYGELVRRPHVRSLRLALLLDEGWRLSACPHLEPLLREGRAFGLAVILASQFPRDLSPAVRGSCATLLFFAQTDAAQAAEVARAVLGEAHSAQAVLLSRKVQGLPAFTALLHRRDTVLGRRPWTPIRLTPWFERRGLGAGADGPVASRLLTPRAFNPGLEGR
jgi:hypothetical protein